MKKFVLSEIMLLSTTERKAKKVKFSPKRVLFRSRNGTGKSCLIKSIYKTFGAIPAKDHPTWKHLSPISFIRFKVGSSKYSILKDENTYAVFDGSDNLIQIFQGVTKELAPFLADLFDFRIKMPNQLNEIIVPPPAFLFLPYYVDQDVSWQSNWNSFTNLSQIKKYREPIVSYHTGLRPNEYYQAKGELEQYTVKIKGLLVECDSLKTKQEVLKSKLVEFYNIKITIESQLIIAKNALNDSRKDYKHATEVIVDDSVDCPTCGAHYKNSFVERFEIAKDEDRCRELITELTRELTEIDTKIEKENSVYNRNNEEIVKIEAILESKKGAIKLRDVIDSAGRKELKSVFEENSKTI